MFTASCRTHGFEYEKFQHPWYEQPYPGKITHNGDWDIHRYADGSNRYAASRDLPEKTSLDSLAVPDLTGPIGVLVGKRILGLVDVQNLTASAARFGQEMKYGRLSELLWNKATSCRLHAFYASTNEDGARTESFRNYGYQPHVYPIHYVHSWNRIDRRSNIDFLFATIGGAEAMHSEVDTVVLATGDGDLAHDVALAIKMMRKTMDIVTLSLAGATSGLLQANINPNIRANIEVGRDLLNAVSGLGFPCQCPPSGVKAERW